MSVQYYPNGIGGTVGDSLDTCKPLQTTGNVWYVSSLIGTDAASPAGQNREKPLATLAQAVTNASNDDIIVFLQGHTQTLTARQDFAKRLILIGEGTTAGKPGVSFICNQAANNLFAIGAGGVELRNIYFPANAQANSGSKISVSAADVKIRGCYFDCGPTDLAPIVSITTGGDRINFENTTFISTATTTAAQPFAAVVAAAASAVTGLTMFGVTVSAGTVGFSNYAAIDLSPAATMAQVKMEQMSLLLGADINMGAVATGRVNVQLATGGSRVAWG